MAGFNPITGRNTSMTGGGGYNGYSAGKKRYGSGRQNPNQGKTANKAGYKARDIQNEARKNALMRYAGR
jgi:hypothetical protein